MQTQPMSPGGAAEAFYSWTVIVLVVMAIAAAIVVIGIIYGRRQAAERHRAEEAAEERAEEAGLDLPPEGDPIAVATNAEPVAKAPDPDLPIKAEPTPEPKLAPKPVPSTPPEQLLTPPPPAWEPEPTPIDEPPLPEAAPVPPPREAAPPPPARAPNLAGSLALTTIKGLGPKVAAMLAERGITQVDQLAALSPDQASELDIQLGAFTGRMARDRWIDQARLLASGDTAAYEAEFGKLG